MIFQKTIIGFIKITAMIYAASEFTKILIISIRLCKHILFSL